MFHTSLFWIATIKKCSISIGMLKFLPDRVNILKSTKNRVECYQTDFPSIFPAGLETNQEWNVKQQAKLRPEWVAEERKCMQDCL